MTIKTVDLHIQSPYPDVFHNFVQISEEDAALVPRSEVLLGHMLAASLAQFKYPEEWQFFLRTEVGLHVACNMVSHR